MPEARRLRVVDVIEETADARSIVLEVPEDARAEFDYRPGQFLTVAVPSDQTGTVARCEEFARTDADGNRAVHASCPRLRASIEQAVKTGRLPMGETDA